MQSTKPPRPIGVTILAVLAFVTAAYAAYAGAMIITSGAALTGIPLVGEIFAGLILAITGIVLFIALIWSLIGWGYLTGRGWARAIGLIFAFLGILFGLASVAAGSWIAVITLLTGGLTIFYLFTGPVKAFFASGPSGNPSYANPTKTSGPSFSPTSFASPMGTGSSAGSWGTSHASTTHTSTNTAKFCNNCGATVGPGSTKCASCGASL